MPQIPDANSLGLPNVPQPSRQIATYQPGIAEAAQVEAGQSLARTGQELGKAVQDVRDVQDRLAMSSATSDFLSKKLELDEAATKDQDYATLPDRYAASLQQAAEQASSGIKNRVLQAQFQDGLTRIREAGIQTTRTLARGKQKDADVSWINDQVNTGIDTALKSPDEESRVAIFDNIKSSISAMADPARGSITQADALKLKKAVAETYAEKRAGMLVGANPSEAVKILKPSGSTNTGDPTFDKTNGWIDYLPADKRIALYEKAKTADAGVQARVTASDILTDVDKGYQAQAGKLPTTNVADAIFSQESGGKANPPTSVDGAVGTAQILPDTFKRYAKPGEDINNPDDNKTVGKRIVADLEQKYPNDPARVAVAYFSGEGNVAPADSPTPYLRDTKDGNGKSVSSYVQDVTGRLGTRDTSGQPVQTKADYYRANYVDIVEQARAKAIADRPDDQRYVDLTVAQTEQRMSQAIRQQELSYKADSDTVYKAFSGGFANGKRPTSVDEMVSSNKDVAAAWDRMQQNNPQAALAVETRILTANAKASDHDTKTYGSGFYDLFNGVHAAANDPARISDPTQLYSHIGPQPTKPPDFPLTGAPGMKKPGNLDPWNRPVLHNADGSYSTTSSMSIGSDAGEVLIPTVVNGVRLTTEGAIERFKKTGENFGTFETPEQADDFATKLHNAQASLYDKNGNRLMNPGDLTVAGLEKLTGEMNGRGTPESSAVDNMKKGAMAYAKHQLSFETDYGILKIPDPKGADAFNVGFTPAFFKAYDDGIKAGKTPYQLLSKDSPDFIVDKLVGPFKRPKSEEMQDRINAGIDAKQPNGPDVGEIRRGYKFKGGNPALPGSWEAVSAAPSVPVR